MSTEGVVYSNDEIRVFVALLSVPFNPATELEWRVNATSHDKSKGQVMPYANVHAYINRLNRVFGPHGWRSTQETTVLGNLSRVVRNNQTINTGKVIVKAELEIFGINTHSATGEMWADDDNAQTRADAQAFKRAAEIFGLGRYIRRFKELGAALWVPLDEKKRPKHLPQLPPWAIPTEAMVSLLETREKRLLSRSAPVPPPAPAVAAEASSVPANAEAVLKVIQEGATASQPTEVYTAITKAVMGQPEGPSVADESKQATSAPAPTTATQKSAQQAPSQAQPIQQQRAASQPLSKQAETRQAKPAEQSQRLPAQQEGVQRNPQMAFRLRRDEFIAALGDNLLNDVLRTVNTMHKEHKLGGKDPYMVAIEKCEATVGVIDSIRQFAEALGPQKFEEALDLYQIENLASVPTIEQLYGCMQALKQAFDEQFSPR